MVHDDLRGDHTEVRTGSSRRRYRSRPALSAGESKAARRIRAKARKAEKYKKTAKTLSRVQAILISWTGVSTVVSCLGTPTMSGDSGDIISPPVEDFASQDRQVDELVMLIESIIYK